MELAKEYQPGSVEERWLREWEEAGLFRGDPESGKEPFCMVIPPPNVTGNLHIGHVLVYTLHDIMARWKRMQGFDVLWLPGTDHAGIATQMVVERALAAENKTRHDLGRVEFEKRVWEWKETYGNRIIESLRLLGSSCDWERQRFTLDEGLSTAVRAVFCRLYNEDLIYRDRYIVNWCPRCHTAISDLETEHKPIPGKLYTVRYPAKDGSGDGIQVATTRPETMFGDVAVAVHPDDDRFRDLVGTEVCLPLTDKTIPIIADPFVEREFGTGAVKITPAHDPNDFEAGRRNKLPEVVALDNSGRMTAAAGRFEGMDRFEARDAVVAALQEEGVLLKVKDHDHAVGHCQRCHTMIEPLVSKQWFLKIQTLAEPAIQAVEEGRTEFIPGSWAKTYFEWMRNIHDWCISRQLWWGHRIPAWYCDPCDETFVLEEDPDRCPSCSGPLRRDEDVLDTWFSSALWPFSTMGWPEKTRDLQHYYPTQLLITGFDIIFFWVARMIMMGTKFMGEVPFRHVYIHGLVRDSAGQKMSKSKGNTVDPAELQERYGTDAVRFFMAILASPGSDIPLDADRMDGYRAFANKLWNACRFAMMRLGDAGKPLSFRDQDLSRVDRWILSRADRLVQEVDRALEQFRVDRASDALYHFVWHEFCDWYIEFVKPDLSSEDGGLKAETSRAVLQTVLDRLLRMLHPFMPFITEELWEKLPRDASHLAVAAWPVTDGGRIDPEAEDDIQVLKDLIAKVRNLRAESRIDPGKKVDLLVHATSKAGWELVSEESGRIAALTRASAVRLVDRFEDGLIAAKGVSKGFELAIPLAGLLDLDAERTRLDKDLAKAEKDLAGREKKLHNPSFMERAPAEVVEKERSICSELREKVQRLRGSLKNLEGGDAS
ncbi:MAG: valine--tRNA ligase [Acidobacteria bacterium]|uniref:Valine--tRNA ligase n=1 Tax=Candidatus Polarisedimenticola svalbardensis TaxID=2886004 RepID=A0A8J6Y6G8_9BACT|nr:valine--tRNA ligase [Candidatus Polarisedimenticola svalbardensis]